MVGVLCVLSLAKRLAVNSFCQVRRMRHFVELGLRRRHVPANRSPLAADVVVIGVIVAGVAAVYGVSLYWWRRLITGAAT